MKLYAWLLALLATCSVAEAQIKISQLPAASTPLTGNELIPCVQNTTTEKCTAQSIANLTAGGGGNVSNTGTPVSGQLAQWTNATTIAGLTLGGDCTLLAATITCTKTNAVAFGTFATANAATPPAIGGTTPAAGTFTTETATTHSTAANTGNYQINGVNFVGLPNGDTTGVAIGENAAASQSGTNLGNVIIGSFAGNQTTNNSTGGDTYVGQQAGQHGTTGGLNVAIGVNALRNNTTGTENTAIGVSAVSGASSTAVTADTAVGYQALTADTTGSNVAVGANALQHNTTGAFNVAIGFDALQANVQSQTSVAIGYAAMQTCNETATNISCGVAVGYQALQAETTGFDNVAIGSSQFANQTGSDNVSVGVTALQSIVSASQNTAVGDLADRYSTGANNTMLGWSAGIGVSGTSTYTDTTAVGLSACSLLTTGNFNICLGEAGNLTTGGNNILLGNSLTKTVATASSQLDIGDAINGSVAALTAGSNLACGTSPTLSGTDMAGTITTGTGTFSTCTLTLALANGRAPTCLVIARSGTQAAYTTTDNGTIATLAITTAATGVLYDYMCPRH